MTGVNLRTIWLRKRWTRFTARRIPGGQPTEMRLRTTPPTLRHQDTSRVANPGVEYGAKRDLPVLHDVPAGFPSRHLASASDEGGACARSLLWKRHDKFRGPHARNPFCWY